MCEISCDRIDDIPSIITSTGIVDVCRNALVTGICPSSDIQKPTFFEKYDVAAEFGYAVPSKELVNEIKSIGGKWLSIGSGRGFVEAILLKHGVDLIASDILSPEKNPYFMNSNPIKYCDIEIINAVNAIQKYPDRHVIISWPCVDEPWAHEAIKRIAGNVFLIYIGESIGGCTADTDFHVYLRLNYKLIKDIAHIQFYELNDSIKLYTRKV